MHLTRWLAQFPGDTWQARWVASDLDGGGTPWPEETDHNRRGLLFKGARALICLGVILPDYPWLLDISFACCSTPTGEPTTPQASTCSSERCASCGSPTA